MRKYTVANKNMHDETLKKAREIARDAILNNMRTELHLKNITADEFKKFSQYLSTPQAYNELDNVIFDILETSSKEKDYGFLATKLEEAGITYEMLSKLLEPQSVGDREIVDRFFKEHKPGNGSYWTGERQKTATIDQIVKHANNGNTVYSRVSAHSRSVVGSSTRTSKQHYTGQGTYDTLKKLGVSEEKGAVTTDSVKAAVIAKILEERANTAPKADEKVLTVEEIEFLNYRKTISALWDKFGAKKPVDSETRDLLFSGLEKHASSLDGDEIYRMCVCLVPLVTSVSTDFEKEAFFEFLAHMNINELQKKFPIRHIDITMAVMTHKSKLALLLKMYITKHFMDDGFFEQCASDTLLGKLIDTCSFGVSNTRKLVTALRELRDATASLRETLIKGDPLINNVKTLAEKCEVVKKSIDTNKLPNSAYVSVVKTINQVKLDDPLSEQLRRQAEKAEDGPDKDELSDLINNRLSKLGFNTPDSAPGVVVASTVDAASIVVGIPVKETEEDLPLKESPKPLKEEAVVYARITLIQAQKLGVYTCLATIDSKSSDTTVLDEYKTFQKIVSTTDKSRVLQAVTDGPIAYAQLILAKAKALNKFASESPLDDIPTVLTAYARFKKTVLEADKQAVFQAVAVDTKRTTTTARSTPPSPKMFQPVVAPVDKTDMTMQQLLDEAVVPQHDVEGEPVPSDVPSHRYNA